MPFQDFDAARRERARGFEPISFTLGGKHFTCLAQPVLADTFDLLDAPEPFADDAPQASAVRAMTLYIEKLIATRRQQRAFRNLLKRRREPIDGDTIIELSMWLAQEYSGRPTVRPSDSSDGSRSDGPSSNIEPSAPDATSVT